VATNQRGRAQRAHLRTVVDEVLARRGLDLTVEEVAAAAGVTRQTVHRHLGGREAILTDALLRGSARFTGELEVILDGPEPFDWRLREAIVAAVRATRADPAIRALVARLHPGNEWPQIDPAGRFVDAARAFFRPRLVRAVEQEGVVLRADVDRALDWLLRQALLPTLVPSSYGNDDDAVRREVDLFVLPAVVAAS
jgi:AcrR family transcriptional regulator